MSVALNTISPHPPSSHPGGRHLLWWALGASLLVHIIILPLLPWFGNTGRLLDNRPLTVTLLATGSPAGEDTVPPTPQVATPRRLQAPSVRPALAQHAAPTPTVHHSVTGQPAPIPRSAPHGLPSIDQMMAQAAPSASQSSTGDSRRAPPDYRVIQYGESWRLKVERLGTMNFPEELRNKSGTVKLRIILRADGYIKSMEIVQSSGNKAFEDAVQRIAHMGEPYAAFPPDLRKDHDSIPITRTWRLTPDNRLQTR